MFVKPAAIFTLVAVSTRLTAAATPPACLLAAVNQQSNPSDVAAICRSNAAEVQSAIGDVCGSNIQVALDAFAATCQSAGVTISPLSSTTTTSTSSSTPVSGSSTITTSIETSSASPLSTEATVSSAALSTTTAVIASAYYDSACSCTRTASFTSTSVSGPSAIVIIPANSTVAAGTATATRPGYTGAASKMEVAYAGFVMAAGLAMAL